VKEGRREVKKSERKEETWRKPYNEKGRKKWRKVKKIEGRKAESEGRK
jgi:hypothetical protein